MKVLAIGSHPDDIEFGCGGSLIRFARQGHDVYVYVATFGEMGGDGGVRRQEQEAAAQFMGVKKVFWGGYRDCHLQLSRKLIESLEAAIREVSPDYILVHYKEDTHQDHRILADATISATRYVPNFLFYEGPTTVNFTPNVYIDIHDTLDDKLELLRLHASQVTKVNVNMPDVSILDIAGSTAKFRGIQGRTKTAEAFVSLRLFFNIPAISDPPDRV